MRLRFLLLTISICVLTAVSRAEPVKDLKVPSGFAVELFAGPELANDIYCMSISSDGRVIVAGRGYIRELIDDNNDGVAERASDLVTGIQEGPMGLLLEGNTLYAVTDGGLWRFENCDGKRPVTMMSGTKILALKTGGEHHAHAVRRGPDGWLYVLCGNNTGVNAKAITTATSPVKAPIAGCLIRVDTSGKNVEVIADGFRNAYDFDFNTSGEPFTFDSDNERCVGLPWYEPNRFYRIVAGGHYGWLNPQFTQTWRTPPYFYDTIAPLATLGRGSPTACICYRHTQFANYQNGFFLADWTFGKIWFAKVERDRSTPVPFLEAVGDSGFAPTGLAVHPKSGDLFACIGGRGTRGSVYRIHTTKPVDDAKPLPMRTFDLGKVVVRDVAVTPMSAIRKLQLSFGDLAAPSAMGTVWEGYTLRQPPTAEFAKPLLVSLRLPFPSGNTDYDRELSRTLAALGDNDATTIDKTLDKIDARSDPVEDVHYLVVLAQLRGTRSPTVTARTASAIVALDGKYESRKWLRDRHWTLRLTEVANQLLKRDMRLTTAIIEHPEFGRVEHVWLAKLDGISREQAVRRFVARASNDREYAWNLGAVELLGALPIAEVRPWIVPLWSVGGLEVALLPLIAKSPIESDRAMLVSGLCTANPKAVMAIVDALAKLPKRDDDTLSLLRALRRLGDGKPEAEARAAVGELLRKSTQQSFGPTLNEWSAWVERERPELAKRLNEGSPNASSWKTRFDVIDWANGSAANGLKLFAKFQCAACHNGAQAVGPSLEGVAKRFSRADIWTAIIDPNRDVPARYRTTEIATNDGKSLRGIIVYEAIDGIILQTGATETVRITGDRIESKKTKDESLMPVGSLDLATDREIADLMSYLLTLTPAKP